MATADMILDYILWPQSDPRGDRHQFLRQQTTPHHRGITARPDCALFELHVRTSPLDGNSCPPGQPADDTHGSEWMEDTVHGIELVQKYEKRKKCMAFNGDNAHLLLRNGLPNTTTDVYGMR